MIHRINDPRGKERGRLKGIASYRPDGGKKVKEAHISFHPHSHTVAGVPIPIFEMRDTEVEI